MTEINHGIIGMGTGDSSVLFECTCTNSDEVTAKSGTLQTGASITSKGVLVGASGGIQFDLTGLDAAIKTQLDYTGQVSFDIDVASWASHRVIENGSGVDRTTTAYFIHWNSADNAGLPFGSCLITATNNIVGYVQQSNETGLANSSYRSHDAISSAKDGFVTVTISWNGAKTDIYYNGVHDDQESRTTFETNLFEYLMVGSTLTNATPITGGYIKNVVVSSKPVSFATHPKLANAVWYGDSFVANTDSNAILGAGCLNSFESYFRRRGFKCDCIEGGVGGAAISNASGNAIIDQIDGSNSLGEGVATLNPKIVCYRGGTNDAINETATATIFADLQTDLIAILAVADHVIVGTIPTLWIENGATYAAYRTAAKMAWINTMNSLISSLPSVMEATSSDYAGRVHIVDQFTEFGGHDPDSGGIDYNLYLTDDFHPSGWGHWKQGELYAKKAEELLG